MAAQPQQPQPMSGFDDDDFNRLDKEAARMMSEEAHEIQAQNARRNANEEDCSYNSMGEDPQLDESIQELERISSIP